jgi:hypothetical protein
MEYFFVVRVMSLIHAFIIIVIIIIIITFSRKAPSFRRWSVPAWCQLAAAAVAEGRRQHLQRLW